MKRIVITVLAVALLVGAGSQTAIAEARLTLDGPLIGASFGIAQQDGSVGKRVSYWAAAPKLALDEYIALWFAMQKTVITDADMSGIGPKLLLVVGNDEYKRVSLLIGGGWLNNFTEDADGNETDAFTFDLGLLYEFLKERVYVGGLGSAIDFGGELDWSADIGVIGRF